MYSNALLASSSESTGPFEYDNVSIAKPKVLFFAEQDMTGPDHAFLGETTSALARTVFSAKSVDERVRIIRSVLGLLGFSSLGCVVFQSKGPQVTGAYVLSTYSLNQFDRQYFDDRRFETDPRIIAASGPHSPYVWDLPYLVDTGRQTGTPGRISPLLRELERADLRSGVTFGLSLGSSLNCVLSFASPNAHRQVLTDSVVGQSIAVGLTVYQLVARYVRDAIRRSSPEQMSPIQRNILRHLVNGMGDKQIATQLHTSTHNVDYHLRVLRRKYDVSSRVELAYMAGRLDLI